MRIRRKAFPWTESDCTMFDLECKAAHHAGGKAHGHAAPAHH
jgi:hypothetical protein